MPPSGPAGDPDRPRGPEPLGKPALLGDQRICAVALPEALRRQSGLRPPRQNRGIHDQQGRVQPPDGQERLNRSRVIPAMGGEAAFGHQPPGREDDGAVDCRQT